MSGIKVLNIRYYLMVFFLFRAGRIGGFFV